MLPRSAVATLLLLVFFAPAAGAAIIWDYSSTDGVDTVSGTLVTDGDPADLSASGSFNLISIETVVLNGTDITAASNWFLDRAPPFSTTAEGAIAWDTVSGVVDPGVLPGLFIRAFDTTSLNLVQLAVPGSTTEVRFFQDGSQLTFSPTSTTFSPSLVPEPSTAALVWLGLGGLAVHRRRRGARFS